MNEILVVSEAWRAAYPGACAGVLAMGGLANPQQHEGLQGRKAELEAALRARFAGRDRAALKALPEIQAYSAYYKRFGKTYHVLLQLEGVALKGQSIPAVAMLVEAMFMAELQDLLLTAGHDLDVLKLPATLDVASGQERYTMLNGQEQSLKPGDMFIRDGEGVISSVIYGPDRRTRIGAETRRALFTVYAPAGIGPEAVHKHLETIRDNALLVAPSAQVELLGVFS